MKTLKGHLQRDKDVTTAIYESGFGSSSAYTRYPKAELFEDRPALNKALNQVL